MNKSKRMFTIIPVLIAVSAFSVSSVDNHSLINELCENNKAALQCSSVIEKLDWLDWISGSSSTQFHFIDLLELMTP